MTKCPHAEIRFCPLYIAAHIAGAGGCDDGRVEEGGCAVTRGMDYAANLKRLEVEQFAMVARCQYDERTHERRAQQRRNLAVNGIH